MSETSPVEFNPVCLVCAGSKEAQTDVGTFDGISCVVPIFVCSVCGAKYPVQTTEEMKAWVDSWISDNK